MARIEFGDGPPDPAALFHGLGQASAAGRPQTARIGGVSTDPLSRLFAREPAPDIRSVLSALQATLRQSIVTAGGLRRLVDSMLAALPIPPPAGSDPPAPPSAGNPAGRAPVVPGPVPLPSPIDELPNPIAASAGGGAPGTDVPPVLPHAPRAGVPAAGLPGAVVQPTGGTAPGRADPAEVAALLPKDGAARREVLAQALGWLVSNLDQPQVLTAGCTLLGPALNGLGVPPDHLEALAALLASAAHAGAHPPWSPQEYSAWRSTAGMVARWTAQAAAAAAYAPPFWAGTVVAHERRGPDLAVIRVRTFLPYPYLSGQYAPIESPYHPESWRPCWIATPPPSDNVVEVHVRASGPDDPGTALVGRVTVGDRVRMAGAEGDVTLAGTGRRDLLFVAHDIGVAPMRALLSELDRRDDPRHRCLLWMVTPQEEPYDLAAVLSSAGPAAEVTVLGTVTELIDLIAARPEWSDRDVYVAGTPTSVAAMLTVLGYAGVPAGRIRSAELGP